MQLSDVAIETSPGVFHAREWGLRIGATLVEEVAAIALAHPQGRARLCMHPSVSDAEQQMLIALRGGSRDPIHRHPLKREALVPHLGAATYRTYDDAGLVTSVSPMGGGGLAYVSSPLDTYHALEVTSDVFVFWEFALGPFDRHSTVPAPWENP